jgi:hypothetical protein
VEQVKPSKAEIRGDERERAYETRGTDEAPLSRISRLGHKKTLSMFMVPNNLTAVYAAINITKGWLYNPTPRKRQCACRGEKEKRMTICKSKEKRRGDLLGSTKWGNPVDDTSTPSRTILWRSLLQFGGPNEKWSALSMAVNCMREVEAPDRIYYEVKSRRGKTAWTWKDPTIVYSPYGSGDREETGTDRHETIENKSGKEWDLCPSVG